MVIPFLDLLAALALAAFASGMGAVTYRAVMLLIQLIPPKPHWVERGALLVILTMVYLGMLMLDIPSVLAALRPGGEVRATEASVLRTATFAAYLWTLSTILLMLARGQLGSQPKWRRG